MVLCIFSCRCEIPVSVSHNYTSHRYTTHSTLDRSQKKWMHRSEQWNDLIEIQCSTERATIPFVMMNDSMVRCLLLLLWFGWWFQISFDGFWPKYPLFPLWWHTRGWDNQHSIPSLLWWVLSSVGFLPSPSILECHYTSGNAVTIVCMYIYIWSDHGKIKRYSIAMMYWLYE